MNVRTLSSFVPSVFILVAMAATTLACSVDPAGDVASAATAEPSVEATTIVEEPAEPAIIMLAIDASLSMLAEDTEPNRFGGAQEALNAFLDQAPADVYIGLVSFHGIATLEVAPTTNRAVVRSALASLVLDEATAIGEAIFTSIESLEDFVADYEGDAPPARIVVLSDGETTVGRPDAAAIDEAMLAGIAVSTVVFGTDAGVIQVPDSIQAPGSDLPVPVPVNAAPLAEIANQTGGEFWEATTTPELVEIFVAMADRVGD